MKSAGVISILAGLCIAELVFIIGLVGGDAIYPMPKVEMQPTTVQKSPSSVAEKSVKSGSAGAVLTPTELVQRNNELETKLAEVTKELDERKSEISFSYGSVRQSGRFVGMTFRKMFETASAREAKEAQERMADNQINVLSLGPFIQDAEVFESDPAAFAQFQGPLISEVLGLPPERSGEVEALLSDLKAKSLKVEEGSPEWMQINDAALQRITALLPEAQRAAMKSRIEFLQEYGVLFIPAYSMLRVPTPTVVPSSMGAR